MYLKKDLAPIIKELRQWYVECYCGERMQTGDFTYDLENVMATLIRLRSRLSCLKRDEDVRFIERYLSYIINDMERVAAEHMCEDGPSSYVFDQRLCCAHDDVAYLLGLYKELANHAE